MKATHSVKINGTWYRAGAEIPADTNNTAKTAAQLVEKTEKTYTKKDITFMKVDDLRKLAAEQGIDGADEMTGTALKPLLIEKFGL